MWVSNGLTVKPVVSRSCPLRSLAARATASLTDDEIELKFRMLADGRLDPGIPDLVRSLPGRSIRDLTDLLRST